MAGDPEEMRARAALMSMQERITRGPHSALNVPANATPAEVRAAFLSLTKQYHPARFGRMAPEVQRLSNEVFLGIRSAHDVLAKAGAAGAPAPRAAGAPNAAVASRGTGNTPVLARTKTTPPGGTPIHPQVGSTTSPLPVTNRPPAGRVAPQPTPARPHTGPVASTPQAPAPPAGPRATGGMPAVRPPIAQPTSPTGAVRAAAPHSQHSSTGPLPTRPAPTAPAAPNAVGRTTGAIPATPAARPTSSGMASVRAAQPHDPAPTSTVSSTTLADQKDAATALDLLRRGHWSTAKQLLQALTGRVPASKPYRALLAYARGREALAAGRKDEAHDELQRALVLHPELDLAKAALAEHWSINFHKK